MSQSASNVVPLRHQPPALPIPTPARRLMSWSESWRDEPGVHLPDLPPDLVDVLPIAIEQAMLELAPSDPSEVMAALTTMAGRRGFPLPDAIALELDVEVMSAWPRDLWRKAFQSVWERFEYRRMPEVPDFRKYIAADLEERQSVLHRLESIRLRLETVRLRRQWDEEARRKKR